MKAVKKVKKAQKQFTPEELKERAEREMAAGKEVGDVLNRYNCKLIFSKQEIFDGENFSVQPKLMVMSK